MSGKTTIKTPKPAALPQPQRAFIHVGRQLTWAELLGRPQTAIGIEPLSPWSECEILDGSLEQLQARYQRLQDEKEAAERDRRERSREVERARQPKRCSPVLSKPELLQLRPDAELMETAKGEPPINEVCKPLWMTHPPEFFVSQLFNDDDLVDVVHAYGSGATKRLSGIKHQLAAYCSLAPNALAIGEEPKRRRVVVRFPTTHWKQLSFLTRSAQPMLIVAGASGALNAWVECENWPQKKLIAFASQTIKLGGELPLLAYMPGAPAATLTGATYEFLHRAGFVRDHQEYKARNFTLYWRAPLPPIPPKGRGA